MGVCASPDGVALPVGPTVPVPTAYFPLTNGSTHSWPIPEYWAYNTSSIQSKKTAFVQDSYFGTVVQCNATAGASPSLILIQPPCDWWHGHSHTFVSGWRYVPAKDGCSPQPSQLQQAAVAAKPA